MPIKPLHYDTACKSVNKFTSKVGNDTEETCGVCTAVDMTSCSIYSVHVISTQIKLPSKYLHHPLK